RPRSMTRRPAPARASATGTTTSQSAASVIAPMKCGGRSISAGAAVAMGFPRSLIAQRRPGRLLRLGHAHGAGIVGPERLVGAVGQRQHKGEEGEADDDGGQN